jgi:RNA polymerase sigma factor (sigma-70 family)
MDERLANHRADESSLEDLARLAIDGDRGALDLVVRELQGPVYHLALRMLWNREDAEDAAQEILVRIVTRLSQFDFRSRLHTWAYRVAVNYILDVKKSATERLHLSFERFADALHAGLDAGTDSNVEHSVLVEEVKVGCTLAMLQCLDRPHRLAYVLGDIMELKGPEAAEVLDVSPELFRKRLQHARAAVLSFTRSYCGLASDAAPCRCDRQVASAVRDGRIDPQQLVFAGTRASFEETRAKVHEVENARWALEVHRTSHPKASSIDFARKIIESFEPFDHKND